MNDMCVIPYASSGSRGYSRLTRPGIPLVAAPLLNMTGGAAFHRGFSVGSSRLRCGRLREVRVADPSTRRGSRDPGPGIAYPAMLDVPTELVTFVAELLAAETPRPRHPSRGTRGLACEKQEIFALAWFRERRRGTDRQGFGDLPDRLIPPPRRGPRRPSPRPARGPATRPRRGLVPRRHPRKALASNASSHCSPSRSQSRAVEIVPPNIGSS